MSFEDHFTLSRSVQPKLTPALPRLAAPPSKPRAGFSHDTLELNGAKGYSAPVRMLHTPVKREE